MGICGEKRGLALLWIERKSPKLDNVSRALRENWTTEDALSVSGEEDQMARSSAYREA